MTKTHTEQEHPFTIAAERDIVQPFDHAETQNSTKNSGAKCPRQCGGTQSDGVNKFTPSRTQRAESVTLTPVADTGGNCLRTIGKACPVEDHTPWHSLDRVRTGQDECSSPCSVMKARWRLQHRLLRQRRILACRRMVHCNQTDQRQPHQVFMVQQLTLCNLCFSSGRRHQTRRRPIHFSAVANDKSAPHSGMGGLQLSASRHID